MSNRKEYRKNVIEFKHDISGKLRKMRLERELSIEELSDNINIAPIAIKSLEIGKFRELDLLFHLAIFYNKKIKLEFY